MAVDDRDAPVARTIQECLHSALWNGTLALAPLGQPLPSGLVQIPFADRPPSYVVVAWNSARTSPLIRSFTQVAGEVIPRCC